MAKIGEGDPRWIVEERSDAANVNNWHWIERDVLNWSKDKMNVLLTEKTSEDSKYKWQIKSITTDGISTVGIRKGRIKQIFDLELQIMFAGQLKNNNEKEIEGKITVPEFSWDTNENNVEFNVTFTSDNKDSGLRDFIKKSFKPLLLETLAKYKEALNIECTQGLVLPTKSDPNPTTTTTTGTTGLPVTSHRIPPYDNKESQNNNECRTENQNDTTKVDPSTFSVNISKTFNCAPIEVYNMFLSPEKMMLVTNSPAYIEPKVGGKFAYIDGTVSGNFIKLDEGKYIEMNWRLKSWPEPLFSVAKLTFTPDKNKTCELAIKHDKIPAHDLSRVDHGWKRMFLDPMHALFA